MDGGKKSDLDISTHLQEWSAAQTQGKLQPFPSDTSIELQQMLAGHVNRWKLPGAVLYIATSDGVWMGAAGDSNLATKTAMKPTDRFRIGKLSEMFVAVVCLQLAEDGYLDLDGAIANWLPTDVSTHIADRDKITVRQLLNHTSGLANADTDAFKRAVRQDPNHKWTAKEMLNYAFDHESAVPRGNFHYSSSDYLLLQLIIEKVTGKSLAQITRSRILAPLKLSNTFTEVREPIPAGFAQGYQDWNEDKTQDDVTKPLINTGLGVGGRGLVSNAPDLVRFFRALFSENSLLNATSLDEMLTHVGDRERFGYGLGITSIPTPWGEAWGQMSQTTGFTSAIMYLPVHDLTLVAWTNSADHDLNDFLDVVNNALDLILDESN